MSAKRKYEIIPVVYGIESYKGYPLPKKPYIVEAESIKEAKKIARDDLDKTVLLNTSLIVIEKDVEYPV